MNTGTLRGSFFIASIKLDGHPEASVVIHLARLYCSRGEDQWIEDYPVSEANKQRLRLEKEGVTVYHTEAFSGNHARRHPRRQPMNGYVTATRSASPKTCLAAASGQHSTKRPATSPNQATRWLETLDYRGDRCKSSQRLKWPRSERNATASPVTAAASHTSSKKPKSSSQLATAKHQVSPVTVAATPLRPAPTSSAKIRRTRN